MGRKRGNWYVSGAEGRPWPGPKINPENPVPRRDWWDWWSTFLQDSRGPAAVRVTIKGAGTDGNGPGPGAKNLQHFSLPPGPALPTSDPEWTLFPRCFRSTKEDWPSDVINGYCLPRIQKSRCATHLEGTGASRTVCTAASLFLVLHRHPRVWDYLGIRLNLFILPA